MLRLLHFVIVAIYVGLPIGTIALALFHRRRDKPKVAAQLAGVAISFISGLSLAIVLIVIYARALHTRPLISQVLIAAYLATSMLMILRTSDAIALWVLRKILRLRPPTQFSFTRAIRLLLAYAVRLALLLGVGVPYVVALVLIYRPKAIPSRDPLHRLGLAYEDVKFRSEDGLELSGWWVPASSPPESSSLLDRDQWGKRTAIVCHGLLSDKSYDFNLGKELIRGGFNVLIFDFRAHGESGGQLTACGAIESRDVIAAIRWVRKEHSVASQHIYGVGASTGAVALITAAASGSAEGQAIEAIAAYGAYDDFSKLAGELADFYFEKPLSWLMKHVALPIASVHVGADLMHYSPARDVAAIWPRPVLFIHSQHDDFIPFERGAALFEAASQPKYHVWFPRGSHADILNNSSAAELVKEFLKRSAPIPVI